MTMTVTLPEYHYTSHPRIYIVGRGDSYRIGVYKGELDHDSRILDSMVFEFVEHAPTMTLAEARGVMHTMTLAKYWMDKS